MTDTHPHLIPDGVHYTAPHQPPTEPPGPPHSILYIDLGSPYAYLAAARAEAVLGRRPDVQPLAARSDLPLAGHGLLGAYGAACPPGR